jgi:uncharacterized membrane protein YdjX (TVP38/TMEM64 family)
VPLGARAVEVLMDPGELSRWWAAPFLLIAIVYLPAVWASLAPIPDRRPVFRRVLMISLILMVLATVLIHPFFAIVLLIPSTLLAIAAGLIFQRPAQAPKKR